MQDDFMAVTDHFETLVAQLEPKARALYHAAKHSRVETAFGKRNFLVYKMSGREPEVLDRIIVNDFECDNERGASTELTSTSTKRTLNVDYSPIQVFDFPIFVWIPLRTQLRWAASPRSDNPSLSFPLVIRTMSRLHLRERGVIYMETGPVFGKEFDNTHAG